MPPRNHRSSSVYSDDFSTTSSQWTTTYRKLPKKQPMSIRFLSWAAGAPPGSTVVKKKTRDSPDDRSTYSGWSTGSYFGEQDTQLYWVSTSDDRSYYSGSSSSGRSGRSGRSSRSSRKSGGGSRRKHFNGAVPPPQMPPPPGAPGFGGPGFDGAGYEPGFDGPGFDGPGYDDGFDGHMEGHFSPPPPDMGGHYGGGYGHPPPPPPPPMNPPAPSGAPAFINVTGQHQAGNPFNRGQPGGGRHMGPGVEDWDDESDSD